jgi:hypothetical protein
LVIPRSSRTGAMLSPMEEDFNYCNINGTLREPGL